MNFLKLLNRFSLLLVGLTSMSASANSLDPIATCQARSNADSSTQIVLNHSDGGNVHMDFFVGEVYKETDAGTHTKNTINLNFMGNTYISSIDIMNKTALLTSANGQEELECIIY